MLKGFIRKFKPLKILTEEQVDTIWGKILDILEVPGLKFDVETPKALKIFDEAGCKVDYDTKMVRFPQELVVECLSTCPSSFRVEARSPKNDLVIGGERVYIQPGPGLHYLDIDTFDIREPTRQEFYDAVTIYDALPNLHFFHPMCPNSSFEGCPPIMQNIETYAARARNSTKVNRAGSMRGDYIFTMEIARTVGAKGLYGVLSIPPLSYDEDRTNLLMATTEQGFPLSIASGPVWGASSPATIVGSIISSSVELVGGIVLAQLIRPGHPVYVGTLTFPQNMRTGDAFFGNIVLGLFHVAFHQVWQRYNIPTSCSESALPNSKCMDFQSGYEKGMLSLASAIAGDNIIWIHGTVYGQLTAHPIQAIMDDDIAGMVGHFLEGFEVNDETLAVELMKQVGSGPDFYLNKEHTRKWWRREQFIPAVAETSNLHVWLKEGKKAAINLAKEKMEEILATHKVSVPLTANQEEEIEKIVAEARKFYKGKGMM